MSSKNSGSKGKLEDKISIKQTNDSNAVNASEASVSDAKPSQTESKRRGSRLPVYTANGLINRRQRRHSDGQSTNSSRKCCIHRVNGAESEAYEALPASVRTRHASHRCLNNNNNHCNASSSGSNGTTPLSTPSTPTTDYRRNSQNRNFVASIASRNGSKSSLTNQSCFSQKTSRTKFDEYMPLCEVQRGLEKGEIVEGILRINPRNYSDAYISAPEGGLDIYIGGMRDRNRALKGDRVAVKVNDTTQWRILHDIIESHKNEWGDQLEEINVSSNKKPQHLLNSMETIQEIDNNSSKEKNILTNIKETWNFTQNTVKTCTESNESEINMNELGNALSQCTGEVKPKKKNRRRKSSKNKKKINAVNNEIDIKDLTKELKELVKLNTEKIDPLKSSNDSSNDTLKNSKIKQKSLFKPTDLLKFSFWPKCVQRTGKVVAIIEQNHPRLVGGHLRPMKDNNTNWALFCPNDSRVPRIMISMSECPVGFSQHSQHFTQCLFIAKINEWNKENTFPNGSLVKYLGNSGDIEAESEIILTENSIEFDEFPDEALNGLPFNDANVWLIPLEEIHNRRDFRHECVFTIDPSSARDLDDALSIKQLDENLFEVGVHIADVSYFLKEGMLLDDIARRRTTSVYLVQKVIPMLPRILCEKLCSLNAGEDKLTFSVVWKMNGDGDILEEWFGRTIINSCIKLSYELAQDMIDKPDREWNSSELPEMHGNWTYKDISRCVNSLYKISSQIRHERFKRGALKIDKLKLHFIFDSETGLPSGFSPYIYRDSNKLIEEFMLLANMAVARKIYDSFSDKAFLRSHSPPGESALKEFTTFCKNNNFEVDTTNSLTLRESLDAIVGNNAAISKVVAHFLLKTMNMATYICAGIQSSIQTYHHYALNAPFYTHFTSPIRRYPDVVVHRLLAASLKYRPIIPESVKDLHRLASVCNMKKMNSRIVSEMSSKIFLHLYIKQIKKMEEKAIVVQVYDHSFDVMILNCGVICRVYLDQLPIQDFKFETRNSINNITLIWNENCFSQITKRIDKEKLVQIIVPCAIVNIEVSVNEEDNNKLNALLIPKLSVSQ